MRVILSWPGHLPEASSPNTLVLAIQFQWTNWEELGADIQIIASSNLFYHISFVRLHISEFWFSLLKLDHVTLVLTVLGLKETVCVKAFTYKSMLTRQWLKEY